MSLFRRKTVLDKRRDSITKTFDFVKKVDLLMQLENPPRYDELLYSVKERVNYSIKNNKKISKKELEKLYTLLSKSRKYFNHKVLNEKKIIKVTNKVNNCISQIIV